MDYLIGKWLEDPDPSTFPFNAVVAVYLRVGKHFVPEALLKSLSHARHRLYELNADIDSDWTLLMRFLNGALDKYDGRYNYPTYTGVDVLDLSGVAVAAESDRPWPCRDRVFAGLASDTVWFELATLEGRTDLLPEQMPDEAMVHKRMRLLTRSAIPAIERLGVADQLPTDDPVAAARMLPAVIGPAQFHLDRCVLQLSMLPVYVSHDEYMFIRVLQMFETTFSMMAGQLTRAVRVLFESDDWKAAKQCLDTSTLAMRESAPLFSLLATMQVDSFRTFRDFTEGASAIQSRSYKTVESLCTVPDHERRDSMAYRSVPDVRARVVSGRPTLDDAVTAARDSGRVPEEGIEALNASMAEFQAALMRWRQTHYRLAVRMLGERSGTGYTEGTPYLKSVRTIPVFHTVGASHEEETSDV